MKQGQLMPAADIYALGAVLYHSLGGCPPGLSSGRVPLRKRNRDVSRGMEYIVMKCLEREPERRYQKVEQIKADAKAAKIKAKADAKQAKLYLLRSELA